MQRCSLYVLNFHYVWFVFVFIASICRDNCLRSIFVIVTLNAVAAVCRQVLHRRGTPPPAAVRRRQAGEGVVIAAGGVGAASAVGGVDAAEAAVVITPKRKNLTPMAGTYRLLIR